MAPVLPILVSKTANQKDAAVLIELNPKEKDFDEKSRQILELTGTGKLIAIKILCFFFMSS